MALGRVLSTIDWSCLDLINSCEEKLAFFNKIISDSLNFIMPVKARTVHNNDAPWMSVKLKRSIKKRQRALQSGNRSEFKYYRNVVNVERKKCKVAYYDNKIKSLKHVKPRNWWRAVKRISGMDTITRSDISSNSHVDDFKNLSDLQIANKINDNFLEPLQAFQALQFIDLSNDATSNLLIVTELEVWKCLSSLNPWKSSGPDNFPSWVLKEYSIILSLPVMKILNSYVENKLPPIWKQANVIPVPKVTLIQDINQYLRPISLTPILSKVAEKFVVNKHLKPSILKVIDVNQYGFIPGSSTSQALIKMLHKWSEATDGARTSVRILLVDYKKAFDYVDHAIVLSKLQTLDIPNSTIRWIADFLTDDRKQRIKLGYDCFSEWGNVPASVPQGTKLGPWLFILMINDLKICSSDEIKFVDDLTVSETVTKSCSSNIQHAVSEIEEWSELNLF